MRTIRAALVGALLSIAVAWPSVSCAQTPGGVDIDGVHIAYYETGHGAPLLLLHHFGWSGKVWEPFVSAFAAHYHVIVVDLPGHGGSTGWNEPYYDYPRNASRMLKLMDHLGISRFDAIGASTGALTLLEMATASPQRIGHMIVVSSTPFFSEQTIAWVKANACEPVTQQDIEQGLPYQRFGREQVIGLARMFCSEKDNGFHVSADQMKQITAQTLIVHGDRDRIFPLSGAIAEFETIPHAQLWVEPNAGHVFIFHPEHHQEFIEQALSFLER